MKKQFVIAALLVFASLALSAQVFDFTLINKTGDDITEVYVSPTIMDTWGDDVLGVDVLEQGDEVEIVFDEDYEAILLEYDVDYYDLLIVDAEGEEHTWKKLKLETITSLELYFDKKGVATANIKYLN